MIIKINKIKCKRCGWSWQPRAHQNDEGQIEIRQCAKCHSAYFDVEKEK